MSTWITFGDSTTAPRGSLRVYTDLLREALARLDPSSVVINAGVPGNTTEDGRRRFETDVLANHPDGVVIQFGINDAAVDVWRNPPATEPRVPLARFTANLAFFLDAIRARRVRAVLMTPNPLCWTSPLRELYGMPPYRPDEADGFNLILHTYAAAVRDLARQHQVDCLDIHAAFQEYGRHPGRSVDALLLDGMHPNAEGHRLVAERLLGWVV
jgi:lysophospholipase L1-like esterase